MFLIAFWPAFAVGGESFSETIATQRLGVQDIVLPVLRPADRLDEFPRLSERKIDPGNPRAGTNKGLFECCEIRELFECLSSEDAAFERAV